MGPTRRFLAARFSRLWLLIPPILVALADSSATLAGQPPAYWHSSYSSPVEANPLLNRALRLHPLALEAVALGWIACFSLLILILPIRAARCLWMMVILWHTWALSTWMPRFFPHNEWYWVTFVILTAIALIAMACLEKSRQ